MSLMSWQYRRKLIKFLCAGFLQRSVPQLRGLRSGSATRAASVASVASSTEQSMVSAVAPSFVSTRGGPHTPGQGPALGGSRNRVSDSVGTFAGLAGGLHGTCSHSGS